MPSNHLILCRPLLLPPSIFPRNRGFSKESVVHIRWPKYWSFSFSINPSNEYSGLISFRMDWVDLLAVQRTLKSLLQHHCLKASILQCSAFFIIQLSHPYMTTGKTVTLTRWTLSPKYWSFSFKISPSNEYSGLISFRMDWLDLLAVQRILQESSLTPQFKNINSLVLSFLYSPSLTSIHDYWKNHSFD